MSVFTHRERRRGLVQADVHAVFAARGEDAAQRRVQQVHRRSADGDQPLVHQLVQQSDGTLGVKAPESFGSYFSTEKPFRAVGKQGDVKVRKNSLRQESGNSWAMN